jgi:hypothetical protein
MLVVSRKFIMKMWLYLSTQCWSSGVRVSVSMGPAPLAACAALGDAPRAGAATLLSGVWWSAAPLAAGAVPAGAVGAVVVVLPSGGW